MIRIIYFVLLPLIVFSAACSNKEDGPPADTAATITITTPTVASRYTNASTLQVRGSIDDQDILKNAKVVIKNKTSGAVLFTQTTPTGNLPVYSFNWSWTVSGITSLFTATVVITSTDQYNYTTNKEVDIILEP